MHRYLNTSILVFVKNVTGTCNVSPFKFQDFGLATLLLKIQPYSSKNLFASKQLPGFLTNRMRRKLGLFENMTIIVAMVLLDLLVAAPVVTAAARKCPAGQFLPQDSLLNECRRCLSCPDNEIIRRPCSEERDTECGPFYEFRDFNSFQRGEAEVDIGMRRYPKNSATGSPELEDLKNEFSEDPTSESKDGNSAKGQKGKSLSAFCQPVHQEIIYIIV